jgi:hypothetical protein
MKQRKKNANLKMAKIVHKRGFLLPKISNKDKSNFEKLKEQIFV